MRSAAAVRTAPDRDIEARVEACDWSRVSTDLDAQGWAMVHQLLMPGECKAIADLYESAGRFRSKVVMARHGFGRRVQVLRLPTARYHLQVWDIDRHLAPVANRWNETMGIEARYPKLTRLFLERCHEAGQTRPTPLLLRYGKDDYNCLHQDLYGEHVFPLQMAMLLSEPERISPEASSC